MVFALSQSKHEAGETHKDAEIQKCWTKLRAEQQAWRWLQAEGRYKALEKDWTREREARGRLKPCLICKSVWQLISTISLLYQAHTLHLQVHWQIHLIKRARRVGSRSLNWWEKRWKFVFGRCKLNVVLRGKVAVQGIFLVSAWESKI